MTRLWRWLSCRTGHHRETVRAIPLFKSVYMGISGDEWYCLDCGRTRMLATGTVRTPSRRYALKRTA